ncbi:transposase [Paraburkholderia sp. D1E]|uniref:transposase n=1 Tax=Paraburkholderia sp. D1E TaxID=3461398 RepID=UPI00404523A5
MATVSQPSGSGRLLGLTPTLCASGISEAALGISKADNRRCRWLMVELAWSWLRFQPGSRWFNQRSAGNGTQLRRHRYCGARAASGGCLVAL